MVGYEEFYDTDEWNDKENGSGFFAGLLVVVAVLGLLTWGVISWNR